MINLIREILRNKYEFINKYMFKGDNLLLTKHEIQVAKYADLPSTLQSMGFDLVSEGKNFYLREHDSLKFFKKDGMWLYKWWSRNEVGDGIQYLMNHCGRDFHNAVIMLGGHIDHNSSKDNESFNDWIIKANKLIKLARVKLFEPNGEKRLDYLINERGLNYGTIHKYHLGWLPEWRKMPSKIVIPCYRLNGDLIRVKFRVDVPMSNNERYRIMKGSNTSIPFASNICSNKPVIIVESELDAILIAQESGDHIGVIGLGGVGSNLTSKIIKYLNELIPLKLICLDNDNAGRTKTASLINVLQNAYQWSIPEKYGKDPGEAHKNMDIKTWILTGLNRKEDIYRTINTKKSGRI